MPKNNDMFSSIKGMTNHVV